MTQKVAPSFDDAYSVKYFPPSLKPSILFAVLKFVHTVQPSASSMTIGLAHRKSRYGQCEQI